MMFQDIILTLQDYWADRGCVIEQPYDIGGRRGHVPPGDLPARRSGPSRGTRPTSSPRAGPTDGRYGENPNRLAAATTSTR